MVSNGVITPLDESFLKKQRSQPLFATASEPSLSWSLQGLARTHEGLHKSLCRVGVALGLFLVENYPVTFN